MKTFFFLLMRKKKLYTRIRQLVVLGSRRFCCLRGSWHFYIPFLSASKCRYRVCPISLCLCVSKIVSLLVFNIYHFDRFLKLHLYYINLSPIWLFECTFDGFLCFQIVPRTCSFGGRWE